MPTKSSKAIDQALNKFQSVVNAKGSALLEDHGLETQAMIYQDSAVLYVTKAHWSNRLLAERKETIGIFFALWVDPALLNQARVAYSTHALKLRKLAGYRLTSRAFAQDFREAFAGHLSRWPNIRTDFGPLNLFEGFGEATLDFLDKHASERLDNLTEIEGLIEGLLDQHKLGKTQ